MSHYYGSKLLAHHIINYLDDSFFVVLPILLILISLLITGLVIFKQRP